MNSSIFNLSGLDDQVKKNSSPKKRYAPLAEKMRPNELEEYVGQAHLIGKDTLLHDLLKNDEIPSMILWGPPGCGKTSLINVIIQDSKKTSHYPTKVIKLSATTASINDVRKAVTEADKNSKQGRRTVVFMDEIHRFNKLQQDIFLPHVEAGTFILIGATTENPSSGLNSALLSRCRVFVLKKLEKNELLQILSKAVKSLNGEVANVKKESREQDSDPKFSISQEVLDWLAEVCDGDARVALGALEIAVEAKSSNTAEENKLINIDLEDVKESLLKTQILSDKKTDTLYQLHSALHHCILADDDNAALYWLARIMETGEDPVYTATKLIRIASEDISVSDEHALSMAIHTMHGCQMIGMPECDVLLAQCVIYLARAEKCKEVFNALQKAKYIIDNQKGPQPKVPLFIKDTSSQRKLRAVLGKNYNGMVREENTQKIYLPEGLEDVDFFDDKSV